MASTCRINAESSTVKTRLLFIHLSHYARQSIAPTALTRLTPYRHHVLKQRDFILRRLFTCLNLGGILLLTDLDRSVLKSLKFFQQHPTRLGEVVHFARIHIAQVGLT